MRLSDKTTWDKIIYGLLYPGFLGSMLYEMVPPKTEDFHLSFFVSPDNLIRWLILFFYFLDYAHLYGDMEKALGYDPEKKTWIYFVCDVATSVLYLAAFVALKIPKYTATIGFFIPVPWLFLAYKWGGRTDRRYFSVYGVFGLFLGFVAIGAILSEENPLTDWAVVLIYIAFHALAYAMYVLHYHGQYSRQISPQLAEGT